MRGLTRFLQLLLFTICLTGITWVLLTLGVFTTWQNKLSDALFISHQNFQTSIVIIAIDDASLQGIGRWPWNREVFAQLIKLLDTHARIIGVDVSFLEKSNQTSDTQLATTLSTMRTPVVLAGEAQSIAISQQRAGVGQLQLPLPMFDSHSEVGIVNVLTDPDGVVRRFTPTLYDTKGQSFDHFDVVMSTIVGERALSLSSPTQRIAFVGGPGTFEHYSALDVINGKVDPSVFDHRIVLIGATAQDLHDTHITPTSKGNSMSGVEVHANIIDTLLQHRILLDESIWRTLLTVVYIALFTAGIFLTQDIRKSVPLVIGEAIIFIVYAFISFDQGRIINLVYPMLTFLVSIMFSLVARYRQESSRKRFIRRAFSYYLSSSVLDHILEDPSKLKLGGQRREISVLFSDIAGFTSISEKLEPQQLVSLLNEYLTRMTDIVFEHEGVLDKYIGDAVMAFWGAPEVQPTHALLACKTALAMRVSIQELQGEWKRQGVPDFDVRIGVNTGEMVVGNMGSNKRFDYTLIGDNVNLGSRLEGINKEYGTHVIISERTFEEAREHIVVRRLDTVAVKGKSKGIVIYELLGLASTTLQHQKQLLTGFEKARALYEQGKFQQALSLFTKLHATYKSDEPTKLYIQRCKELIKNPPKDWDGVFHAKSK